MSVRVAIVAEDPLAKSGIAQLVDGSAALEPAAEADADVIVWEGSVESLRSQEPLGAPIVALGEPSLARGLVVAGARAVLGRDVSASELEAAVIAVASGLVVLEPQAIDELIGRRVEVDEPPGDPLTPRELEVLSLLAEGLSNRQIAAALGISENTVKFHVNAVLSKLDAETRTEAVVRGARLGIVVL